MHRRASQPAWVTRGLKAASALSRGLLAVVALAVARLPGALAQTRDDNPHGAIEVLCSTCHSPDGWKPARIDKSFDHGQFGLPLDGGHGAVACASCHKSLEFTKVSNTCASCHQDIHWGELGVDCAQCHSTRSFSDRAQQINHALTRFPLEGAHRTLDCRSCHAPGPDGALTFRGAPTTCFACHRGAFDQTVAPSHVAAAFSSDCTSCHSKATWRGASFDHSLSDFALTGAHQAVTCQACHADKIFTGRSKTCVSCHLVNFDQTKTPPHQAAHFDQNCLSCHTTAEWKGASYDHNATRFPLTGAHQAVQCATCHGDEVYVGRPMACLSCHQGVFDKAAAPPHRSPAFAADCATCHTTAAWPGARFDHNSTNFPLTGAHQAVVCKTCHADGVYIGRATTCVSCHQPAFDQTKTPPHQATGFPTDCRSCHTTATWTGAKFDHGATGFPLTGAHQATPCQTCHADGVFDGKPTTCQSCHQGDFDQSTNPNHRTAGFPTTCTTCHTTATWQGGTFNHGVTAFPLTGAHQAATCLSCHANGVYKGTLLTCAGCHQNDFATTTDPNHPAAKFATTCTDCHTTATWQGGAFNHATTAFPLTGSHLAATCKSCHADNVFDGKPTTCVSCHQGDFDQSTNPNHKTAGFPTTCMTCHTTTTWTGAAFNHATTAFPLTGAHLAATCVSCHVNATYKGTTATCVGCHQADFTATTDPSHSAAKFPTTCSNCHSTATWQGGTFNHTATAFPLTGAHIATRCKQCHADNVFGGKPTTCVSCHLTDFNATVNPNHKAAGFPTDCLSCHTTARWDGATFDHDTKYFRIYSGKHQGQWATCATCHTNPANYQEFTCLTCHEHSQIKMDDKHKGEAGYSYVSSVCLSCHPRV